MKRATEGRGEDRHAAGDGGQDGDCQPVTRAKRRQTPVDIGRNATVPPSERAGTSAWPNVRRPTFAGPPATYTSAVRSRSRS